MLLNHLLGALKGPGCDGMRAQEERQELKQKHPEGSIR